MFEQEFTPQYLTLSPGEDGKVWVAEIIGDDPVYRLKRIFLPEVEPGVFEIYDGYYQIHGIYPGISPFQKEYCKVINGHMERRIPVRYFYQEIEKIKSLDDQRLARLKYQINQHLQEIAQQLDHPWVSEEISYQLDQVDSLSDVEMANAGLSQLLQRKDSIIKHYHKSLELRQEE